MTRFCLEAFTKINSSSGNDNDDDNAMLKKKDFISMMFFMLVMMMLTMIAMTTLDFFDRTNDFRSIYDRTKKKNLAEEDEIKDMSEEGFIFLTGRFVKQNCFTLC